MSYQQFAETYKSWSDWELFQLLQNKDAYQPQAVEAATVELNSRNLHPQELEILLKRYDEIQRNRQNTFHKKLARNLEANTEKLIADFDPFIERTDNRSIRLICYMVTLTIAYSFIADYRSIRTFIKFGYWNSATVLQLMPSIFVPIGIYYFWRKKRFGWAIIAIWLTFSIVLITMSLSWQMRVTDEAFLSRFFPRQGLIHYLLLFLLFGGLLLFINTKKIRESFEITNKFRNQIVIIAVLFTMLNIITIFL